jgi:hypothetical protein
MINKMEIKASVFHLQRRFLLFFLEKTGESILLCMS